MEGKVRRQQGGYIRAWLEERCEHWNQRIDEILQLHLNTPSPATGLSFQRRPFEVSKPSKADERQLGFLDKLLGGRRSRIETQNAEAAKAYENELAEWSAKKAAHDEHEAGRQREFEGRLESAAAMESFLEQHLVDIKWPRETLVSYSVEDGGACVALDVDFPRLRTYRVSKRGWHLEASRYSSRRRLTLRFARSIWLTSTR
jgi:hypothetical protein